MTVINFYALKRHCERTRLTFQQSHFSANLTLPSKLQARLAEVEIELMALEYTDLRALANAAQGGGPGAESSLLKLKGTEIQQTLQEMGMDLAAHYSGMIEEESDRGTLGNSFADSWRKNYMYGRAATIYGGSNEVQKNITAKYILGL